jgi:small subunit ribosomal protein S3
LGQKVHPKSFRIGIIKTWNSRWFTKKDYAHFLHRDITLRQAIKERLKKSGIGEIEIERNAGSMKVNIFTSKPGLIIGRQGVALEELRHDLSRQFDENIEINITEVSRPDTVAQLIAESIAEQLERRLPFRRVAKQAVAKARDAGIKGIKVRIAGRLNGADIAREESFKEGNIPLHTIRADVEFGTIMARTTYGSIGVKVWTYRGEVFTRNKQEQKEVDKAWLAKTGKKNLNKESAGRLEQELVGKPKE